MKRLRAAVIGVGHLGRYHAEKYAGREDIELVAAVDIDLDRAGEIAATFGARPLSDYRQLADTIDIASVAVPTSLHHQVVSHLLRKDVHVLVEKPITASLEQGRELMDLNASGKNILQIGHIERFNPVTRILRERLHLPLFIEAYRIAPFQSRGTDVDVVLDLMIHDIDLLRFLVDEPIVDIQASGATVLSSRVDIANARIRFENGCVANVTASRVGRKQERTMRVFQPDSYLAADFDKKTLTVCRKADGQIERGSPPVNVEKLLAGPADGLADEIASFIECVRTGRPPLVDAAEGVRALETAFEIIEQIEAGDLSDAGKALRFAGMD